MLAIGELAIELEGAHDPEAQGMRELMTPDVDARRRHALIHLHVATWCDVCMKTQACQPHLQLVNLDALLDATSEESRRATHCDCCSLKTSETDPVRTILTAFDVPSAVGGGTVVNPERWDNRH